MLDHPCFSVINLSVRRSSEDIIRDLHFLIINRAETHAAPSLIRVCTNVLCVRMKRCSESRRVNYSEMRNRDMFTES